MLNNDPTLDTFLAKAAQIGADAGLAEAQARKGVEMAKKRRDNALESLELAERENGDGELKGGFNTPRLTGLTAVGIAFDSAFKTNQGYRPNAQGAVEAAVVQFTNAMTKASEATTKGGGTVGLFKNIITYGNDGERVRAALAARHTAWQDAYDKAKALPSTDKDRKATMEMAARYVVIADTSTGKQGTKAPRHNGRPARTVNGVVIEASKGTTRTNQLAAACEYFEAHGDKFLANEVLDAFLDNGGKYEASDDCKTLANKALAAIDALLVQQGGKMSGDAMYLTMPLDTLKRIAKEGKFTAAAPVALPEIVPVAPVAPVAPPVTQPQPESSDDSKDSNDSDVDAAMDKAVEVAATAAKVARGRKPRGGSLAA